VFVTGNETVEDDFQSIVFCTVDNLLNITPRVGAFADAPDKQIYLVKTGMGNSIKMIIGEYIQPVAGMDTT